MLDFDLLKIILVVAIAGSIITTLLVQKIKEDLIGNKKVIKWVSIGVSLILGTLFSICFSDLKLIDSLWVGLICYIGADAIYKAFEEKVFTPFGDMAKNEVIEVVRDDNDES